VAIIVASGAMYALDETSQGRADQAFVSPTSVRVPERGSTHNLSAKFGTQARTTEREPT